LLDKNPDLDSNNMIMKIIEENEFSSIMHDEPFTKALFFEKIIHYTIEPIIYLDFDLLYSGFITAKILPERENVCVYRLTYDNLLESLVSIQSKISSKKCLVIIDSLNGFFNLFDEKDIGRLINAYIMLLGCVARTTKSRILFASMARLKDGQDWVLTPSGRHVLDSESIVKIHLKKNGVGVFAKILDKKNSAIESIEIF